MKARAYQVIINGKQYDVDVIPKENGQIQVTPVLRAPSAAPVEAKAPVPATSKASAPTKSSSPAKGGAKEIIAPINGVICKVNIKPGDSVNKDSVLFVLEAMKMENEIFAGTEGTVKSIAVNQGEQVEPGALLAVIE